MQKQFQQCEDRYACVSDDESINLLFRIYDDYMEEKGYVLLRSAGKLSMYCWEKV